MADKDWWRNDRQQRRYRDDDYGSYRGESYRRGSRDFDDRGEDYRSGRGYEGRGDFSMSPDGRLAWRAERDVVPFVYAGAAVLSPALFNGAPSGPFSLNRLFGSAIEAGRLYGTRLEGTWMHVGTPAAVAAAEAAIVASAA